MNNASTQYQEHLPKFNIMLNKGKYFREKKNFDSNKVIKITNPNSSQITFYNAISKENNNE